MKRTAQIAFQKGAKIQNRSAMSTIVLPDLKFDYGALEPVVRIRNLPPFLELS
jgi:hypothetical protein